MYKEFKHENRTSLINLDKVDTVNFFKDTYTTPAKYNVDITTGTNGMINVAHTEKENEALRVYNEIQEALRENKNKSDIENRLRSYIENIEKQIAKEVKSYLDEITKQ